MQFLRKRRGEAEKMADGTMPKLPRWREWIRGIGRNTGVGGMRLYPPPFSLFSFSFENTSGYLYTPPLYLKVRRRKISEKFQLKGCISEVSSDIPPNWSDMQSVFGYTGVRRNVFRCEGSRWRTDYYTIKIWWAEEWKGLVNLDALVYTAMARTRENLIVLNCNEKYVEYGKSLQSEWDKQ